MEWFRRQFESAEDKQHRKEKELEKANRVVHKKRFTPTVRSIVAHDEHVALVQHLVKSMNKRFKHHRFTLVQEARQRHPVPTPDILKDYYTTDPDYEFNESYSDKDSENGSTCSLTPT